MTDGKEAGIHPGKEALERVRENLPKATPGEWRRSPGNIANAIEARSGRQYYPGDEGWRSVATVQDCEDSRNYDKQQENLEANIAHVIATCPDAMSDILAYVAKLELENLTMRAALTEQETR